MAAPAPENTMESLLAGALDCEYAPTLFPKSEYIQTATGNKVSRLSILCGSHNIGIAGKSIVKPGVILRGDLQLLRVGKYSSIGADSVLRPSYKKYKGNLAFFPMTLGEYVTIGERSVISAAQIGSCVYIGDDCVINKRCIIKDNCIIMSGTILPPDSVIPPLTIYGGKPGRFMGYLPESMHEEQAHYAIEEYNKFQMAAPPPVGKK
eukprot:TRINITY_DN9401_c0_g1_i1.p1 TRINITY_DN9401_c0_g1~~TRINITY_DN9401_c0_g1_i1.p1  ORF type:complete len:207 (-),score=26.98 TRINITY_DN9401_c0_g1_i1:74-694(-)